MNGNHLALLGFTDWQEVSTRLNKSKQLILDLPRETGVYAIKSSGHVRRLKGESDIIYLGHGKIQTRIQNLIIDFLPSSFKNYNTRHTASHELTRIIKETGLHLEVSYATHPTKEDSKMWESKLLRCYCRDHIEPPPLNNTRR